MSARVHVCEYEDSSGGFLLLFSGFISLYIYLEKTVEI